MAQSFKGWIPAGVLLSTFIAASLHADPLAPLDPGCRQARHWILSRFSKTSRFQLKKMPDDVVERLSDELAREVELEHRKQEARPETDVGELKVNPDITVKSLIHKKRMKAIQDLYFAEHSFDPENAASVLALNKAAEDTLLWNQIKFKR